MNCGKSRFKSKYREYKSFEITGNFLFFFRKHKTCPQPLLFDLSINRLPLRNRSKRQFWSILLKIVDQPNWPAMVVAIYSGTATPVSSEAFLRPMVDEIKELYVAKLVIDRTRFVVSLRAIIADMPARAFIEGSI